MEGLRATGYDELWDSRWDDMKQYGPFSRHVRRILKDMIQRLEFDSVLDVGCGQGSFLEEMKKAFPHIRLFGVDVSSSAIRLATSRVAGGEFYVLDIAEAGLDKECDLVVCSEVLEHIPDDVAAIRNLKKMTRKYLLVSSPQGRMRGFEKDVGHVRNYAPGELVKKLECSGFMVLSVVEWGYPFYSPLYRDFLDLTGSRGTTGEFGVLRKLIAKLMYLIFLMNSYKRGDELFILATVGK